MDEDEDDSEALFEEDDAEVKRKFLDEGFVADRVRVDDLKASCLARCGDPTLISYRGGKILVWENFCPEKFRRGKIPPHASKVMGKIAPPFSMVKGKAEGRLSLLRGTPLEERL